MGQRNILYTSPMMGLEMGQQGGQGHFRGEPALYTNIANFPQPPNVHTILPSQPSRTRSEHHGPLFYGVHQLHHPPSNHIYMNPSSSAQAFPVPLSHGPPQDQLPFSADSYGRNGHYVDGFGGAFKRKNAEGFLGNFQYGSSAGPMSARPLESDFANDSNCMIQGNHVSQPYQTAGVPWLNQAPAPLPYMHGSMNGGCIETTNIRIQGTPFMHPPPPIPQGHPNLHHMASPPPIHGFRGRNIEFHSQVATSSSLRFSTNGASHPPSMNPFLDAVEVGPRFVGPVPPNGLRLYQPHRREMMLDAMPRQRSLPHLRVLPEDGVAILDISSYHDVGDSVDHHRDMRLDIDHMSYEELLALGEQIGSVNSGLSEEIISRDLKTRTFVSATSCSNLEEIQLSCVICQGEYEEEEKIGVLNCGHEYHVDCVKKWLLVKNICPICKSSALSFGKKDLSS